jgi:pimeloyl-ACP methyl ester carboxylesterase
VGWPRTSTQITAELRALLRAADVPPAYVLVGHSLGGLYARHYATRFPEEVAGLLLLDPAHEDYDAYMPRRLNEMRGTESGEIARESRVSGRLAMGDRLAGLVVSGLVWCPLTNAVLKRIPPVRRYRELYRDLFTAELKDWPEDVRGSLTERHTSLEWLLAGLRESQNLNQLYSEVRAAGPMPDVPLIILCSTETDAFRYAVSVGEPEELLREEIEGKQRLYADLAASVTRGEVRLVNAGHFTMHFRRPDAVVSAMEDMLASRTT